MRSGRGVELGLAICLLVLVFERDAQAYLDPGAGSYAFQMAVAGLIGGLFVLKTCWRRVKEFICRLFRRTDCDNKQP